MSTWKCGRCHKNNTNAGDFCMYCGARRPRNDDARITWNGNPLQTKDYNNPVRRSQSDQENRNNIRHREKTRNVLIIAGIALLAVIVLSLLAEGFDSGGSSNTIVQVIAANEFSLGLRKDGTVAYAGSSRFSYLSDWKNLKTLYPGFARRADGSYVSYNGMEMNLPATKTVVHITGSSSGNYVALMSDGTVMSTPDNDPYAVNKFGFNEWSELGSYHPRDLAFGGASYFVLQQNGTVLCWPEAYQNDERFRQIKTWKNIDQLTMDGDLFIPVGLRTDGTVVAITDDYPNMDISGWTNVSKLFAFDDITVALRKDGDVLATGGPWGFSDIARIVSKWTDIVDLSVSPNHVVGLRRDGSVVAAGTNTSGQCNVGNW